MPARLGGGVTAPPRAGCRVDARNPPRAERKKTRSTPRPTCRRPDGGGRGAPRLGRHHGGGIGQRRRPLWVTTSNPKVPALRHAMVRGALAAAAAVPADAKALMLALLEVTVLTVAVLPPLRETEGGRVSLRQQRMRPSFLASRCLGPWVPASVQRWRRSGGVS